MAADGLHTQRSDAALIQNRQNFLLEAVEVRVKGIQRHLHGVKWKAGVQHGEMDLGVLVAGKAGEANLSFFFGAGQGFGCASRTDEEVWGKIGRESCRGR